MECKYSGVADVQLWKSTQVMRKLGERDDPHFCGIICWVVVLRTTARRRGKWSGRLLGGVEICNNPSKISASNIPSSEMDSDRDAIKTIYIQMGSFTHG
jgi:hypothetical protein